MDGNSTAQIDDPESPIAQDKDPSPVSENFFRNKIDLRQVVEDLGFSISVKDGRQEIKCPAKDGEEHKAGLCIYPESGFFCCHHCKVGGDAVRFVEFVQSISRKEAALYLAKTYFPSAEADIEAASLPPSSHTDEYYLNASLFEAILQHGKEMLFQSEGSNSRGHLITELGYEGGRLINTQWIHWPTDSEIRDRLIRMFPVAPDGISGLELTGSHGDGFRLAFPYRDRWGVISGFVKLAIPPPRTGLQQRLDVDDGPQILWDETPGLDRTDLFNLWRLGEEKTVLVVEDCADALYLNFKGIRGVVATSGGEISSRQFDSLSEARIKRLVLALGSGKSAGALTEEARGIILSVLGWHEKGAVEVRVVAPEKWSPHFTAAQFLKEEGEEGLVRILSGSETGNVWFVRHIFLHYKDSLGYQKNQTFEKFIEIYTQNAEKEEKAALKQAAAESTGLSVGQIEEKIYAYFEELARAEEEAAEQERKKEEEEPIKEFTVADLELETGFSDLRVVRQLAIISPYLAETLDSDVRSLSEGLTTGFEGIDGRLRIPHGAATLICSPPGSGQTAFLLNLLDHMVHAGADKRFYFFSSEESRTRLALKYIMIRAGVRLSDTFNLGAYINYFKSERGEHPSIDRAIEEYRNLADAGRLVFCDHFFTAKEISEALKRISGAGVLGAVFIDTLQGFALENGNGGEKEAACFRTVRFLSERAAALNLPLVLGFKSSETQNGFFHEMNGDEAKDPSERGVASRFFSIVSETVIQNADLVLQLAPGFNTAEKENPDVEVEVDLICRKNRWGPSDWRRRLLFERPVLRFSELVTVLPEVLDQEESED